MNAFARSMETERDPEVLDWATRSPCPRRAGLPQATPYPLPIMHALQDRIATRKDLRLMMERPIIGD